MSYNKPNGWKEVKLKEIVQFNPSEKLKKKETAVKISMDKLDTFRKKINNSEYSEYRGGVKFRNGDTLMARITPSLENGKTSQVDILGKNEIGFGSTEFIVLREIKKKSLNDYIYYLSISPKIRDTAIKSMTGTSGRQRVQREVLENSDIILPPIEEQKAIADTLSALDDKIELNNKINKNLKEQVQLLFKHWFADFEFPNEEGQPYKTNGGEMVDSELGMIPKGWKIATINNYAEVKSGFAFKSKWWKKEGTKVIKITNISTGKLNLDNCSYVGENHIPLEKRYEAEPSDLLIALTGATLGKMAIVPKMDEKLLVNQRVGKFIYNKNVKYPLPFLYCLLNTEKVMDEIIGTGYGSAQPNISPANLGNINILLPPIKLINHFNFILKPFFENYIYSYKQNQKLSEIRDTLLPKLMSGEVRMPLD